MHYNIYHTGYNEFDSSPRLIKVNKNWCD